MVCDKSEICFFDMLKIQGGFDCQKKPLCLQFCDKRSELICREKGKEYRLKNRNNQYKILSMRIDGGVITTDKYTPQGISKCDYLFLIDSDPSPVAILIELKGTDLNKAISQIESTLDLFENAFKKCKKVYGRIVYAGGTPKIRNTPKFIALQRKLKSMNGSLLANEVLVESVENIC